MSSKTIKTDEELFALFMPTALEHCQVMRPGDIESASVIIGAAIWSTLYHRERRRAGTLFKLAVQQGALPLQLVQYSESTALQYQLKHPRNLRCPTKRATVISMSRQH